MGPQHPRVKELRRGLEQRGARSRLVMLEGPRTVGEALEAGIAIETVIVPETSFLAAAVADVRSALPAAVEVLVVRDNVFERLAPTVSPQPMLALAARPTPELPRVVAPDDVVLVLVEVADPGNMGTLLRVADAAAARCVVVAGGVDPWSDKSIRASAGSILRVPVVSVAAPEDALRALRGAGATIVATDVRQGVPYGSGALDPPVAIVLGSEAHGLAPAVGELADLTVRIEMPGRSESLNVAMAGTLLAFETRRPRQ
jgi:TrmH family RNA methyltransferase